MSDIIDFITAGGVQIGDYLSTERTKNLIPADGRDIKGFGFTKLEPLVVEKLGIEDISQLTPVPIMRNFCITSNGLTGFGGNTDSDFIRIFDMVTDTASFVNPTSSVNGYLDSCCSDDGKNIYVVGFDTVADDVYVVKSNNSGTAFTAVSIFAEPTTLSTVVASTTQPRATIQCNKTGDKIRIVFTGDDGINETVVLESTDGIGDVWAEILTPRQTLNNPATSSFATDISRDLSTVVISNNSGSTFYISTGGTGALTEVTANLPEGTSNSMRVAISDDGSNIVYFNITTTPVDSQLPFHISEDGGSNWSTFKIDIPTDNTIGGTDELIMSARFNPDNANEIFFVVRQDQPTNDITAGIYIFNLDSLENSRIGSTKTNTLNFLTTVVHLQSEIKPNENGFIFGFGEADTRDAYFGVEIVDSKFIDNKIDTNPTAKLFSGKQVEGIGFTWSRITAPTESTFLAAYLSSDKVNVIGTLGGGEILVSTDSGGIFTQSTNGFNASNGVRTVDGADDASVIIAGGTDEIRRTVNQAASWTASIGFTGTGLVHQISTLATGVTALAIFDDGVIDKSTDSGANFSALATPFSGSANTNGRSVCVSRGDDQIIFAGNQGGEIKISLNGGTSFVNPSTPPVTDAGDLVYQIACISDGSKVLAAIGTKLFLSTDTGDTWTQVAIGFTHVNYRATSMSDDGLIMMATDGDGQLVRSIDGGLNFFRTVVQWKEPRNLTRGLIVARDGSQAYAMNNNSQIFRAV